MGPNRDNTWPAEDVVDRFPPDGPPILWRAEVSNGYSGPAVVGNRVYLTDFVTDADLEQSNFNRLSMPGTERVLCFDADTGAPVWTHQIEVTYAISYPNGPRATPLVDEDRVYTLGAEGHLICFDRLSGQVRWSRQLKEEYQTTTPLWGYAAHPTIDGDKLICLAGGKGSHTVALNKFTGEEIWRYGTASEQGYCPVRIIELAGVRQMLVLCPEWIASINPENGQEWWRQDYQADNGSIILTPTVIQQRYLFVGGFNKRNLLLELNSEQPGASPLMRDRPKELMSPVNVQPFVADESLFGIDADGTLMAVDIPSGRRLWETGQPVAERPVRSGTAFIVKNRDRFFLFTENGELVICQLSRSGYQEIDRCQILEPTNRAAGRPVVWSAPAYAGSKMYARNDRHLICVDLSKDAAPAP
jgi:outer membrane protein assembly factor BamB